jgi:hypothetical protein
VLHDLDAAGVETAVLDPSDLTWLGALLAPKGPRLELRMLEAFAPKNPG